MSTGVVPTRVQEFLARAEWCEGLARTASNPETRRTYENLARGWREFAEGPLVQHAPAAKEYPLPQLLGTPQEPADPGFSESEDNCH